MPQVSMFRLYVLRAMYVFMFVGLALVKWPAILNPPPGLSCPGIDGDSVPLRGWSSNGKHEESFPASVPARTA